MIARPSAEALGALPSREWGLVLPHLRAAMRSVPVGQGGPIVERLRSAPPSALASAPVRRELCRAVASDDRLWEALERALDPLPSDLAWFAAPDWPGSSTGTEGGPTDDEAAADAAGDASGAAELERLRERVRAARRETTELRRRLDGADARADRETGRAETAEARASEAEARTASLTRALAEAEEERRRALERGARRADDRAARLEVDLARVRRELEAMRVERDALVARVERAEGELARLRRDGVERRRPTSAQAFRPGRPSRLPPGVEPSTTQAAALLLHEGRRVIVDGYNVTLRHRGGVDLAQQRAWLLTALGAFVARIAVRPVVVFDGQRSSGARGPAPRGVEVVFTDAEVIADDEIVLMVAATDEPVVVVTDDQGLRARVEELDADVVPGANLLGAIGA